MTDTSDSTTSSMYDFGNAVMTENLPKVRAGIEWCKEPEQIMALLINLIDSHSANVPEKPDRIEIGEILVSKLVQCGGLKILDYDQDGDGSFVHLCVMNYDPATMEILLRYGADDSTRNNMGQTPIQICEVLMGMNSGKKHDRLVRIYHML